MNIDWDPSSSHFGIDINSTSSVVYQNITLVSNSTDMRITSNITYNSGIKLLTVLLYSDNNPGFRNYSLNLKVDLMRILPPEVAMGFSGATHFGRYVELHQIFSWYFNSNFEPRNISRVWSIGLVIYLLIIDRLGSILWRKEYRIPSYNDLEMHESVYEELTRQAGPKVFSYDELLDATKNFAEKHKLGRGAFGWVYIGFLTDLKIHVAIKRLKIFFGAFAGSMSA
jgi:Legume lectin domain